VAFQPKPRTEPLGIEKQSFHPGGDCTCREKALPTGRFQGGSQTCDRCGKLIGRRKWRDHE